MKTANVPIHAPFLVNSAGFFEDFLEFSSVSTTGRWTSTSTGGTNAIQTSGTNLVQGGVLGLVPSSGTPAANDAAYINQLNPTIQLIADCSIFVEASICWAEANTNYANIVFGLGSGTVTSMLTNTSGGVATNFSGAVMYKTGASTGTGVWKTCSSLGTTQTLNTSKTATPNSTAAFHKVGILMQPVIGGTAQATAQTMTVSYFYDDQPLMQNVTAGSGYYPIKDTYTFTSPYTTAYPYVVLGVKNGATVSGGMENLYIDYVQVWQKRAPLTNSPD
jgi:hypothetical protein